MLLERKKEVLKTLDKNYALIRDFDGELIALLSKDNEGYYVYTFERYDYTKAQAEALLDNAAGVALAPVVDERILGENEEELKKHEEKIRNQIEDDYFEED